MGVRDACPGPIPQQTSPPTHQGGEQHTFSLASQLSPFLAADCSMPNILETKNKSLICFSSLALSNKYWSSLSRGTTQSLVHSLLRSCPDSSNSFPAVSFQPHPFHLKWNGLPFMGSFLLLIPTTFLLCAVRFTASCSLLSVSCSRFQYPHSLLLSLSFLSL